MFCSNCGSEVPNGVKFCSNCEKELNGESMSTQSKKIEDSVEINGDFPNISSKIPLQLLAGEKLMLQYNVAIISGLAANGLLSLTNKRILVKKDSLGKASLKTAGLLTGVLTSSVRVIPEIYLSDITSVQACKIRGQKAGAEVTTRDGFTHRYIFQSMKLGSKEPVNMRDSFVNLIQSAILRG